MNLDPYEEEWRPVLGWEGLYEVSSQGQVRSLPRTVLVRTGGTRRIQGRLMKQKINHLYRKLTLAHQGSIKYACVHQLVCEAFHGPRPEGQVVRHKNGQYLDNRAENLEWGTRRENGLDMLRHGTSHWANKTHCPQGHEYNEKNTRVDSSPNGGKRRNCRACERVRSITKNKRRAELRRIEKGSAA